MIKEPKFKVTHGDKIALDAPPPIDPEPKGEDIALDIIYEDDELIVINKPVGMVVHPAPGSENGTLVNALIYHCKDEFAGIGGVKRPGIVHRLDKDTSGVMVVAKTQRTLNHLAKQFADHGKKGKLKRSYIAFVWERFQTGQGKVDAPLGRDKFNRLKQSVRKDGRHAITHYKTKKRYGGDGWEITKMQCVLETGRTHQIRVHMAHIKHPLVCDKLYASGFATKATKLPQTLQNALIKLNRQALHAAVLGFEHPRTKEIMLFEAELPDDMAQLQKALEPYNLA
jgi:23S rRNA pseudouridine1911/1915/1917 synthase